MKSNRRGFTLVELAVVIVIIGVLAAFGVPRFRQAVERSKAGEAFNYLSAVRSSQERYHSRLALYAADVATLDINFPAPKYFSVGDMTNNELTWSTTLYRTGASAGYGAYTVRFCETGYATDSNIPTDINPMAN
jgi:prepilin-type N-terminal cleavage/methylation domain-containing protein